VVVKGGHAVTGTEEWAVDVVWEAGVTRELRRRRVDTPNNHGTGCSFASAVAASFARGRDLTGALDTAKALVWRGVRGGAAWSLGAGHGPLDHFGWESPGEAIG
jgi:hydroxymethylpyrimidine/phosphomethylpyrimidine kinase